MDFQSLQSIIKDLLLIIRGSSISQSETISERQVENWINQYRSLLLKQDLDKGKMPNPDYIQTIENIELEIVDKADEDNGIKTDFFVLKSKYRIPKTVDLNHKSGLTFIGTIFGNEIQFVPEGRVDWQKYRKFSGKEPLAYLKNEYLYVHNHRLLQYISIRGIFEVPLDVINFNKSIRGERLIDNSFKYPIPSSTITILKSMILQRELNLSATRPSDLTNDSRNVIIGNAPVEAEKE